MLIRVFIPSFKKVKGPQTYTVYTIEVWNSGRKQIVEKRYSEFEELNKELKKLMATPFFPPKKVLKWNSKVLEHRRQALEAYLKALVERNTKPIILLNFLNIKIPSDSTESLDRLGRPRKKCLVPVVGFPDDAFVNEDPDRPLSFAVVDGVLDAINTPCYSGTCS
ncbi:hypothetical protein LOTGIDRAFT_204046 [Lottia gigantea]|uniref:PX domain-containing protein n=1 Tax=Lottia gigantea TaxID=225164 RepID=V4A766_LOTGI|nr:hypothetical protein LOTGIDRAFT_204046 [Lottia gigantea]ESO92577.1 hypothetical protein LOTGIDRAFT_204046 [Lottia gigantea]